MRELREALDDVAAEGGPRSPALGVLADTGHVCELFASRDDELIPRACLNSTVSGLIRRTVMRPDLLGEDAFHGVRVVPRVRRARRLAALRRHDHGAAARAQAELDAAVARRARSARRRARLGGRAGGRAASTGSTTSTASSPASARRPACCCGACRTPARRARPRGRSPHILMLAEQRGVPVRERHDDVYACYGVIQP